MLDEFDVLLIPESENGNYTFVDTVAAAWAGILPSFVADGGIVVCMSYHSGPDIGASTRIINGTLLDVYDVQTANSHQIDVFDANDALARNMGTYTSISGTLSFDCPDAVKVMEDDTDARPIAVHKTIGKGHVVLLGLDMYSVDANQDRLLMNSILLHRHVVFDNSHFQTDNIVSGFNTIANDLPYYGFAVSSMDTFDPTVLESCEIFVVTYCNTEYNATEIGQIQDFVNGGGALLLITEWGGFGDATDPLMNSFGYERRLTDTLEDSDDSGSSLWYINFLPKNINMHSTKVGVDVLEVYGATGIITMPSSAVPLVTADSDGTATWGGTENADGVVLASAETIGQGRIIILCDNGFVSDHDWDFDATINYYDADNEIFTRNAFRWLAGAGIPEQTVVFDQSHAPYMWIHGSWSPLANFLMFNGYNIEFMQTFNPALYEDADILVINDGNTDYNATEIAYIEDYVASGGALLLWGDNTIYCEQIDPIGQEFDLFVNTTGALKESDDYDTYQGYTIFDGDNIGNHPIMDGVERIEVDLSNAFISIGSGTALVSTDDDGTTTWSDDTPAINLAVYAATTHDMGRVVFLTDVELGFLSDPEGDGFGDLYDSDNPIFIANVFKWLAENRAPTVEVIAPNGGELLNGTITVQWDAVDFDSDPMTFDVYYSDNNGSDWSLLAGGLSVPEFEWNTTQHDDGNSYMILVEVSDGVLGNQDVSDAPFELDNFVGGGPGFTLDPTLLLIIGAGVLVVIILLVVVMKKKGGKK